MMECYDLIIIGGGVVGLSILRAATLQGFNCALVEAQKELLSSASGSNSGIACTGVDASPGTLERALIRDSISQFRIYCQQHNIPTRKCGSLVCLWPWDDPSSTLSTVLKESHDAGDNHASLLTKEEVLQREPNLDSSIKGACHIPGEIVVDPWLYSISLAVHARENGASIFKDFRVDPELCKFEKDIWTIASTKNISVKGKAVVNAAGIFSDVLQAKFFGTSRWMAKPRRGQYRIYDATNNTMITHPIQPIPSQRTKGIFIFSTIYNQIVVGPTALDQSSRIDRFVDKKVADELDCIVKRVIPNLDTDRAFSGEYVGIRPGTDQRDYQIHLSPEKKWIAVAGIRSTGLTASLGIGNYVVRQLACIVGQSTPLSEVKTTPLPPVSDLIRDFRSTKDGSVALHGHRYAVTHPLTKLGWNSFQSTTGNSRL